MLRSSLIAYHHRLAAALVAGVLVIAGNLLGAPGASAHDRMTGSTPADGSVVTAPPAQIRMTFTDEVVTIGVAVIVVGPDGVRVARGKPVVDGLAVTQGLVPLTVSGAYTVSYRVVSSDGHPISGKLRFTATLPPVASDASSSEPASVSVTEPGSAAATPPAAELGSGGALPWVVGLVVLLALAGVSAVVLARRRSA
ncbi:MAG: hypothetical protein F2911_08275 [Actinobacteria bacterium]|uniref:Unannotated protein n=1 Tax=freshwater metagenome TaxID=449393 RepID=A0A6J7BLU1_9ZZZZ|nr:hypothetical protein [Actinomycetota bacterium]MSX37596.1 hypothetical protein [Actinomycetota bacterium]